MELEQTIKGLTGIDAKYNGQPASLLLSRDPHELRRLVNEGKLSLSDFATQELNVACARKPYMSWGKGYGGYNQRPGRHFA